MAASNLTASALNRVQLKLMEMFANGGVPIQDRDPRNNRAQTVAGMMLNNQANARPLYDPTGTCVGVSVYHIEGDHDPDDTDVSTGFASGDCDVPAGDGVRTTATNYDHNVFAQELISIPDGDCGNLFVDPSADGMDKIAELLADKLNQAFISIRAKLNTEYTTFLGATATGVNRDIDLPGFITFNAGASAFDVNQAGFFGEPESLTFLDLIANLNDLPGDYFLHSGRANFYNAVIDSRFLRLNDDQRSLVRWDTGVGDSPISFDVRLDAALGGKNTFAISRGSYAAWNVPHYGPSPVLVDSANNIFVYSAPDPVLLISENGVTRPVFYNITYQKDCTGSNKLGIRQFDHKFQVQFLGGLAASPAATDDHTGILRFRDVTGI